MPIRHTDKGWFWGSKGPFDTKAKALSVARAAHASTFKEEESIAMDHAPVRNLLGCMLHAVTTARILHWETMSYAEHKALAKFYDGLSDLADDYAEAYMGIYGRFNTVVTKTEMYSSADLLVEYVGDTILALRPELPNDTELMNILDEIAALTDKTAYLLTLK
jgi:hypothetical protein